MRAKSSDPSLALERRKKRDLFPYLLLLPAAIYLLVMMVYPFCWSLVTSFTDKRVGVEGHFNGLDNYIHLLTDPIFYQTVGNTLIYTLSAVALKVVFGMIMALVLNSKKLRLRNVFRAILYLPWALPILVAVYTWQWMYSDVGGALNFILQQLHIIQDQIGWLATPAMAMIAVIIINAWRGIPFLGISILSGLVTIPEDMYEAAQIDGAGAWKQFWYITLPSVKNVVLLGAVITTIWTLNDFEIIWLLTRGGPDNGTQVFSTMAYTYGFLNKDLGLSIAISVLTLPFLFLLVGYATKKSMATNDN